jgi:hypothetical protein
MALAAVAIFAIAGGVAYAAIPDAGTGLYHACMLKNVGTIRIIDPATQHCSATLETAIAFGAKGDQGPQGIPGTNGSNGSPGVSPTVAQLAVPNNNCPAGGAAITDAAGNTAYVCNGQNGANGTNGTPFSGTFTSPDGHYSISVTNSGVQISTQAGSSIVVTDSDITVRSKGTASVLSDLGLTLKDGRDVKLEAGANLSVKATNNLSVQASGTAAVQSAGTLSLLGSSVGINGAGSCSPPLRLSDQVLVTDPASGLLYPTFPTGSPTVCMG